jgi:thiamine pyrophosphokinase
MPLRMPESRPDVVQYSLLLFGGLSGRIDQTVHTMSLLHKLRKTRPHSYVLSGESLAWVLDEVSHPCQTPLQWES